MDTLVRIDPPRLPADSDSRLKGYFGNVTHPVLPLERTYCFLCGKPWGFVSQESSQHSRPLHVLITCNECDELMVEMYGDGAKPIPQHILDAHGFIPEPAGVIGT